MSESVGQLGEREAQSARYKALIAKVFNEDRCIALQARLALSQSLCCITEEIMRESRDRIARVAGKTINDPTALVEDKTS